MSKRIEFQMMDMKRLRLKERAKGQLLLPKAVHEEQIEHNKVIEEAAVELVWSLSQIKKALLRFEDMCKEPRSFWRRLFNC